MCNDVQNSADWGDSQISTEWLVGGVCELRHEGCATGTLLAGGFSDAAADEGRRYVGDMSEICWIFGSGRQMDLHCMFSGKEVRRDSFLTWWIEELKRIAQKISKSTLW